MDKTSRIYVAGHHGLVGSAICRRLNRGGYSNLIVRERSRLDLTNPAAVESFRLAKEVFDELDKKK